MNSGLANQWFIRSSCRLQKHPRCSAWFLKRNHLVSYSEHGCNNSDLVVDFKWHHIFMHTILHMYDHIYVYTNMSWRSAIVEWRSAVYLRWIPWFSNFPRGLSTWRQWLIDLTSCRYWKGECDEGHAMQFGALGCIYPEKLLIAWISLQRAYYKKYTMSNCTSRFTEQNNKLHVRVTVFFPKLVWVNRPQRVIDKGITMPCWPWSLSVITAE